MILEHTTLDLSLDVRRNAAPEPRISPQPKACSPQQSGQIDVPTVRFGLLKVDPETVLTFPNGLIGFETCKRYIIVRHQDNSAFRWLQSLDEARIAFPIVEPMEFCADYAPTISDADARFLDVDRGDAPILLFTIVTVPPHNPRDMTANLLAPLVVNGLTRRGKQTIVQNEGYTTRHKIVDEMARRQAAEERKETPAEQAA
jgi:flagellar assembly factor FliW